MIPILSPAKNKGLPRNGLVALYDPVRQYTEQGSGQILFDYGTRHNDAQLGSTPGSDTNDPTWSASAITYGANDYSLLPVTVENRATVITVGSMATIAVDRAVFGNNAGTNTRSFALSVSGTGQLQVGVASSGGQNMGLSFTANTPYCLGVRYGDGTLSAFMGTTKATDKTYNATWGTKTAWVQGALPATIYNGGDIYWQVFYNRVLSDNEYLRVYRYLKNLMSHRGITI
jgi:hypothetical protein